MTIPIQVRITLAFALAVELLKDYIDAAAKILIFEHAAGATNKHNNKIERTHCHIYMFGLPQTRPADAVRDHIAKYSGLPKTDYMVGHTCGKMRKGVTVEGGYIYATTRNFIEPSLVKGIGKFEIDLMKEMAQKHYAPKEEDKESPLVVIQQVRPDLVWQRFFEQLVRAPPDSPMKEWTQAQFKRWIMADYLNRFKPIPRMADLNRYAFSLWMLKHIIGTKPDEESPLRMEDIPLDA